MFQTSEFLLIVQYLRRHNEIALRGDSNLNMKCGFYVHIVHLALGNFFQYFKNMLSFFVLLFVLFFETESASHSWALMSILP